MAVVVAVAVEVDINRSGVVSSERPSTVIIPAGVEDAPIPRFPPLVKRRAVVVAVPFVDVEIARMGFVIDRVASPAIETVPEGEEVPIPRNRFVESIERKFADETVLPPL